MYRKKPRRGRKESSHPSTVVHKITRRMRKNASPDNYELTEDERAQIVKRNLSNPKISEKVRERYSRRNSK